MSKIHGPSSSGVDYDFFPILGNTGYETSIVPSLMLSLEGLAILAFAYIMKR
jgi:hypothetical protein